MILKKFPSQILQIHVRPSKLWKVDDSLLWPKTVWIGSKTYKALKVLFPPFKNCVLIRRRRTALSCPLLVSFLSGVCHDSACHDSVSCPDFCKKDCPMSLCPFFLSGFCPNFSKKRCPLYVCSDKDEIELSELSVSLSADVWFPILKKYPGRISNVSDFLVVVPARL